jgi:hypothetical protein
MCRFRLWTGLLGPVTCCSEEYKDLLDFVECGVFPDQLFRKGCVL